MDVKQEYCWFIAVVLLLGLLWAVAEHVNESRKEINRISSKITAIEKNVNVDSQALMLLNHIKQIKRFEELKGLK